MKEVISTTGKGRRAFLENVVKAGVLGVIPLDVLASDNLMAAEDQNTFEAGPYLQNMSPDAVTIMWISRKNSFSWVEYGDGTFLTTKAFGYVGGLVQANNRINKIKLSGLKSSRKHNYRIVSAEIIRISGSQFKFGDPIVSEILSFTTPAITDKEFRMVIFNDHHEKSQNIPQLLYKFGYKGNQREYDLVVFNGDAFNNVNSEQQIISQLLKPCVDIFAKETPFLFVQGNHEVRGAHARQVQDYFDFKDGVPYHAFTRGPLRIIVLDAGEDKPDDNWEYNGLSAFDPYREKQAQWLEKEIESDAHKKAPFRVLLIHISPWHSGDWHGPMHCQKVFGPVLNKARIDLQLSGHTHRFVNHNASAEHNFPIMIGGGPNEGNRTLIKVHATQTTLTANMLKDDGEIVGTYTINRK